MVTGIIPTPSPDGQMLAFVTSGPDRSVVSVRSLDGIETRQLSGTEGASGAVAWSPNGRWIGFFADGKLKKIAPSGGPAQTIATIPGFQDAAWGAAGQIVFRPINRAAILGISETGGAPKAITTLDAARGENSHRFLQFLPDGRRFLFTARCANRENNALFVGSIDSPQSTRIMAAQSRVKYVPGAVRPAWQSDLFQRRRPDAATIRCGPDGPRRRSRGRVRQDLVHRGQHHRGFQRLRRWTNGNCGTCWRERNSSDLVRSGRHGTGRRGRAGGLPPGALVTVRRSGRVLEAGRSEREPRYLVHRHRAGDNVAGHSQ